MNQAQAWQPELPSVLKDGRWVMARSRSFQSGCWCQGGCRDRDEACCKRSFQSLCRGSLSFGYTRNIGSKSSPLTHRAFLKEETSGAPSRGSCLWRSWAPLLQALTQEVQAFHGKIVRTPVEFYSTCQYWHDLRGISALNLQVWMLSCQPRARLVRIELPAARVARPKRSQDSRLTAESQGWDRDRNQVATVPGCSGRLT